MNPQELRIRCLELATTLTISGAQLSDIERAQKFYDFITGKGDEKPKHPVAKEQRLLSRGGLTEREWKKFKRKGDV